MLHSNLPAAITNIDYFNFLSIECAKCIQSYVADIIDLFINSYQMFFKLLIETLVRLSYNY